MNILIGLSCLILSVLIFGICFYIAGNASKEVIAHIWAWHSFIFYRTYYVLENSLKLKKFKIIFQPREKGSLHFRKKYFTLEYQKQIKTSYNVERRLFNCC
ncbi:hypothetical protein HB796_01040 [Listeria welshimeri]|nr:hypothetical protein [Listeria welshimeri]MBC1495695.1 hypothetical protein [Listeria welshimeri]MBC1635733.1 hypothetical protein [Listeria welshimeri]MBC1655868.1 hypothetical protein [Listeria welshimeri]MBC1950583.1 hypothetical protein [Listeria welshimeri]